MATFDVPQFVVDKNESDFQAKSLQYESALNNLHIVLVVDHSGSMGAYDKYPHEGQSAPKIPWRRWDNTCMVAKYLAKTMLAYDKDRSIPAIFYDSMREETASHADEMMALFQKIQPGGSDDLRRALQFAFDRHVPKERVGDERTLFIVLHDGAATDPAGTKRLIKERLTDKDPKGDWLNVLFVCMGDDQHAINFLKDLDNCKEIGANVDTKLDNEVYELGPKNLLLNAIFEHIENNGRGGGAPVAPTPYTPLAAAPVSTAAPATAAPAAPAAAKGSDKCCVVM